MKRIYKRIFTKLLNNKCPSIVPRTGDEASEINCYSCYLFHGSVPIMLLERIDGDDVVGHKWNEEERKFDSDMEDSINIIELQDYDIKIKHLYKIFDVKFDSFSDFLFHYITKIEYIKNFGYIIKSKLEQFIFNTKELSSKKRIELLKSMLELQLKEQRQAWLTATGISISKIISYVYTNNIYGGSRYYIQHTIPSNCREL